VIKFKKNTFNHIKKQSSVTEINYILVLGLKQRILHTYKLKGTVYPPFSFHRVMLCIARLLPSFGVCLSVCLSRSCVALKRI